MRPPTQARPLAAKLCGAAALLLGASVLIGWILRSPALVQVQPGLVAMVAGTALGLSLGGAALILADLPSRWARAARQACSVALLVLGAAALLEKFFDTNLGLDWPALHSWLEDPNPRPGRMTLATAVGLFLIGFALVAERAARGAATLRRALPLGAAAIAASIALASIVAYLLRLEIVYGWRDAVYMPPHAALGLAALAIGCWLQARRGIDPQQARRDGRGIVTMVAAALAVTTLVAGVMGFAFLQNRVEQMTTENLVHLQSDRSRLFTNIILQHTLLAVALATNTSTVTPMRRLERAPADPAARAELLEIARGHLRSGFAWVGFYRNGELLAQAGTPAPQPELELALQGPFQRELLWSQGFHLRLRLPIRDQERRLGEMVVERSLDVLTLLAADADQWGETGEMMLCGLKSDPFRCVPGRFMHQPFTVARVVDNRTSIVAYALKGKAGVASTADFRGERVLAAYGPVGNYGLGMIVKMDWVELYAPMRKQLQIMMLSLLAIVALSVWLVHGRVRPLLAQLVESRQRAQANEARFLAAAENSPDAFFIAESVRDARGQIADFRVAYMNGNGAKLLSSLPKEQFIGQPLCELVPMIRSGGFFEKYVQVVRTGEALLEEFPVSAPEVKAAWLSQQVVRLGDGVAVTSRDISERRAMEEKFKYMAQNDALTGLPNRALFLDRLEQAVARARRNSRPMALMYLDVDRFKGVNDSLGHAAGDALLRAFAGCLQGSVRRTDTVARLGGDEFTVILEDLESEQDAETVARKIALALTEPIRLGERDVTVTSSIGIAFHRFERSSELSPGALLEQADQALYETKRGGRNGYALYKPGLKEKST